VRHCLDSSYFWEEPAICDLQAFLGKEDMVVKTRASVQMARVQGAVPKQSTRKKPVTKKPETSFMLEGNEEPVTPPWLIDTKAKTPAAKTPKARKPKSPSKAKPATRKPRAKAAAKTVTPPEPAVTVVSSVITQQAQQPSASVPLTRNQAPVVWQKNGPIGAITYWFRATGRSMMARLGSSPKRRPTHAPIGAKLRTKNDLLREIAVLRKENAVMREKLGLPAMTSRSKFHIP
jgi:hypothetical protein